MMKERLERKLETPEIPGGPALNPGLPAPDPTHPVLLPTRLNPSLFREPPGHIPAPVLTQAHPWGEQLPRGSVEKQDRTWSMGVVLRAHMQRSGPLACGCGHGARGVEQSGGPWRRAGLRLTHALPVCVEDKALGTEHCVVDTVEGSQGVHTELSPVTIVSAQQALVLV